MTVTRQPDRMTYAWIERPRDAGLRLVGYADEIAKLRHRGWYCDEYQDEVFRGVVYRLPHSRGFIAGYADPYNKGCAFVELSACATEVDAAHSADEIARYEAEREIEYQESQSAKLRAEEEAEQFAKDLESQRSDMYA